MTTNAVFTTASSPTLPLLVVGLAGALIARLARLGRRVEGTSRQPFA